MAERIPHSEVVFNPHSLRDRAGRVFRWRGDLYRAINTSSGAMFRRLFGAGTIQRLVDLGLLVGTELTEYELDGYELVVRHRTVPFVSYPTEWSAAMMRDAGLLTLDLVKELASHGLTLKDSHPWNLLFDGASPVHIDLTSIIPLEEGSTWMGHSSFCRNLFHPLLLMSRGRDQWARWLMNTDRGTWRRDVIALVPATVASMLTDFARSQWTSGMRRWRSRSGQYPPKPLLRLLERLRSKVERIPLTVDGDSPGDAHTSASEERALNAAIAELRPGSVLSVDASPICYPKLAARSCDQVVAFDTRLESITRLYLDALEENLPILPLVMDFMKPTPSYGLFSHHFVAATERFQCDVVMAPRLVRHLECANRRLDCEQIIDGLTLFSKRWILIGYVPPGAKTDCPGFPDWPQYDNLESFTRTIQRRFSTVNVIPFEGTTGALLVCEK